MCNKTQGLDCNKNRQVNVINQHLLKIWWFNVEICVGDAVVQLAY